METATSTSLFLNLVSSAVTQPPWAFCLLMVIIFNLESVYGQRSAACETSFNLRLPDQVLSTTQQGTLPCQRSVSTLVTPTPMTSILLESLEDHMNYRHVARTLLNLNAQVAVWFSGSRLVGGFSSRGSGAVACCAPTP